MRKFPLKKLQVGAQKNGKLKRKHSWYSAIGNKNGSAVTACDGDTAAYTTSSQTIQHIY